MLTLLPNPTGWYKAYVVSLDVPHIHDWFCRHSFSQKATLDGGLSLLSTHKAADGTCKMLFKLKVQAQLRSTTLNCTLL